jgi:hypothetical protein
MASGVKKIAEQARRILGRRDADADLDQRELELNVRQSISWIVRMRIYESKNQDYLEIPDSLVVGFKNVDIVKDEDLDILYSVLPSRVMDLPYGLGIKLVAPQKNIKGEFYRQPNGFNSISCGLESNCIPGKIWYYQEGDRLYFPNLEHEDRPDKLYIRLVAPAESIEGDDLEIPGDMELEVLNKVLEIYGIYRPQDEINDQNDII